MTVSDELFGSEFPEGYVPGQVEQTRPKGGMSIDKHLNGSNKVKKSDLNTRQRDWFKANGWTFEKVERPNTFGAVTVDLWGFADWLACHPDLGIWLIQTCRHADASTREKKSRSKPELRKWLEAGGHFAVHGWEQPGGPNTRWQVVPRVIELSDLDEGQKRFKRRDPHGKVEL